MATGTRFCMPILPPWCDRKTRSMTDSTRTPSTASRAARISVAVRLVARVDGDVARHRLLGRAYDVHAADLAAGVADRGHHLAEHPDLGGDDGADGQAVVGVRHRWATSIPGTTGRGSLPLAPARSAARPAVDRGARAGHHERAREHRQGEERPGRVAALVGRPRLGQRRGRGGRRGAELAAAARPRRSCAPGSRRRARPGPRSRSRRRARPAGPSAAPGRRSANA